MHPDDNVVLVAYRDDLLRITAARILEHCRNSLPDLTGTVVLLPDLQFAPQLRWQLLEQAGMHGHPALLGPVITTLEQWLCECVPIDRSIPGEARRELMLIEALYQHPDVFHGIDPWQISHDLIGLFDELTAHRSPVPERAEDFTQQLAAAYGISGEIPGPLGREADIVHRLWQAWHEQLRAENLLDPGMAHLQRLVGARQAGKQSRLFLAGYARLSRAELEWLSALLREDRAELILPGPSAASGGICAAPVSTLLDALAIRDAAEPEAAPATLCLDAAFQPGDLAPLQRALALRERCAESPLAGSLAVFPAASAEQEALAIELRVRQWLLADHRPIGIVTEDRRLARRVRALLERAGIHLQDSGGWALSTTSAAAVLERWLETIEEDFAYQPLLDVLKSAFVFPEEEREAHLGTVHRLEQDIILHENIARGLNRYRKHIEYRANRLTGAWTAQTTTDLQILLNRLDQAAEPLREFIAGQSAPPLGMLQRLRESLELLGVWTAYAEDPAGRRILEEWKLLAHAAQHCTLEMTWLEFRAWIGTTLERHDFRPAATDSPVVLLNLQQAQLGRFAGLIMGACDCEHLPGPSGSGPFFNDTVRRELGLPAWPEKYRHRLHQFRRLLECAPRIFLTWHRESGGQTRLPSPWLETIQSIHALAYGDELAATDMASLVKNPAAQVRGENPLPTPVPHGFPAPVLRGVRRPHSLSASSHQRLIDCPYRFYAADALRLKPREEVREALEKSDYGERVHRCLEAFHGGHEKFPGPFGKAVTAANRMEAIALLLEISRAVFAHELEDNFEHRAWRRRWEALVPAYIDWQIERQQEWRVCAVEQQAEARLAGEDRLQGRLDRVDDNPTGVAVIDYKTGVIPKQNTVNSGEAVQLPSYALLTDKIPARVEYLQLDRQIRPGAALAGVELDTLARAVRQRLITVLDAIEAGTPLPAWGDADACRYCEMSGICRRQAWLETQPRQNKAGPH